jgi:hypothetical protein
LQDHQADPVGDHVVHLPSDPGPLVQPDPFHEQFVLPFGSFLPLLGQLSPVGDGDADRPGHEDHRRRAEQVLRLRVGVGQVAQGEHHRDRGRPAALHVRGDRVGAEQRRKRRVEHRQRGDGDACGEGSATPPDQGQTSGHMDQESTELRRV